MISGCMAGSSAVVRKAFPPPPSASTTSCCTKPSSTGDAFACWQTTPPAPTKKEMHTLDPDGVRIAMEVSRNSQYYSLIHLDLHTGLRRSELLGLRWKDTDLDLAVLRVVQAAHRLRTGEIVYASPKTKKSRRSVALSPNAALALRAYREQREAVAAAGSLMLTPDSLVFCYPDGQPFNPDNVSRT
jgi:integrase